ncbi:sulfur carrier protein ThiS [Frankia sp. AgB32]|uniref:sulfur carrier protein ThiS n=1 Tax=Frankia sp. AgB32 TaxID=631119 RepID=UPI002010AF23|nr:sulfur carrier protein ThiS [Frankia sp. AgB32]MCK9894074.1 sulfur carrier protein ThiS [Frankia sp. AgB32]
MADSPPPAPAPPSAARVVVNGATRDVPAGQPLPELLAELGLRPGSVVVEHNGAALTTSESAAVRLADGDILEVVRAVAGG